MDSSLLDERVIAQRELNDYLEAQVNAIAPDIAPLIAADIKVERIGFTRNASSTPYLVYKVNGRRCCTFIKRLVFFKLVKVLLRLKYGIEDRICSLTLTPAFGQTFGLTVVTTVQRQYIASAYLNKFFERYNQVARERTEPRKCDCNDLFDMCLHSVASTILSSHYSS